MKTSFLLGNNWMGDAEVSLDYSDGPSNLLRRNTIYLDLQTGEIVARRFTPQPLFPDWDVAYMRVNQSFFNDHDLAKVLDRLPRSLLIHELLTRTLNDRPN